RPEERSVTLAGDGCCSEQAGGGQVFSYLGREAAFESLEIRESAAMALALVLPNEPVRRDIYQFRASCHVTFLDVGRALVSSRCPPLACPAEARGAGLR